MNKETNSQETQDAKKSLETRGEDSKTWNFENQETTRNMAVNLED